MAKKRSIQQIRTCEFCGQSLEGRSKKTKFCSSSCRAKYWRADRAIIHAVKCVEKHLLTIYLALPSERHHQQAVDALDYIMMALNEVRHEGYQPALPGVE